MEELVRPNQAPTKAPGYRTPPTTGINQATPAVTFGSNASGQNDTGPYARVDEPEDYGWFPRLRVLLAGVIEVISEWKDVSGSFEIDPNACSVWRLRCQSSSLSLTFAALETPSWISRFFIWKNVLRVATVEIIIDWQAAASPRTLTLSGVRFADGTAPIWTVTAGRDVVLVQITSDNEKYGFVAAQDTRVPS